MVNYLGAASKMNRRSNKRQPPVTGGRIRFEAAPFIRLSISSTVYLLSVYDIFPLVYIFFMEFKRSQCQCPLTHVLLNGINTN